MIRWNDIYQQNKTTSTAIESKIYHLNTITLHVTTAGNPASPAILFLHGFPSFWYSWQYQIAYLAKQNFYVIVPDQRGYNKSGKPQRIRDYRLSILVEDMVQLLVTMAVKEVILVGHDWGGIVAWALLKQHPGLVKKAIIINAPYLPAYTKFSFKQLRKSWYVYFFQLPYFPEWMMKRKQFAMLKKTLLKTSLRGTFIKEDLMRYEEAWSQKGSVTAMINWYRALARYPKDARTIFRAKTKTETPVLLLWGMKDAFLEPDSGICPSNHCSHFTIKQYANATHWLPVEKFEEINNDIMNFINE